MNILGLDIGKCHIGIAVCEKGSSIAVPLKKITVNDNPENLINPIKEIINEYKIKIIVYGKPVSLSGNRSSIEDMIDEKINILKNEFKNIQFKGYNERYTTNMACNLIENNYYHKPVKSNISKKKIIKRKKKHKDIISATLILQSYLDSL